MKYRSALPGLVLCIAAMLLVQDALSAPSVKTDVFSWPGWGNGLRFDRFSPADQINTSNVSALRPVWKFSLQQSGGSWEVTPIVVGGVMYVQDMEGTAFALDPESGRELWRFATGQRGRMRAVAWWPGDSSHSPRVIVSGNDRIYALDAATGKPSAEFGGEIGYINIRDGFAKSNQSYDITSPPTVYRNLLITGPGTQEFGGKGPSGDPHAYDAITGKLIWRFNTVPRPGERQAGSWGDGWKERSGPSSWGMYSVDSATGTVFVPVGNPADSYIGTDRPGKNLYSDSIVALDAMTGTYRWHYQMVHHDLFDYDDAAPPALIDLVVEKKRIPALVEVTKQGLMFILDRRTGKPVFGVEERPVPASTIVGEQAWATQPFPIKPVPLAKLGISRADLSTVTPESRKFCAELWDRAGLRDTAAFEPPRVGSPNLAMPGNIGGAGGIWGGVSIDTRTNTIFVSTNNLPSYNYIVPDDGKSGRAVGGYRVDRAYIKFSDQNGMPCIQPPWGELIAINGNSGGIIWRRPLGSAEMYGVAGANTGLINRGSSLSTAGNLVFMGGTPDQPILHAFASRNGEELWNVRLAAAVSSAPMSFVGKSGRQYIVVGTSGKTATDIALIAFALPRSGDPHIELNPAPLATAISHRE